MEELEDEFAALEAILGIADVDLSSLSVVVRPTDDEKHVSLTLRVSSEPPEGYPDEAKLELSASSESTPFAESELSELIEQLFKLQDELLGQPMLFELVEYVRDWLDERNFAVDSGGDSAFASMQRRQAKQELEAKKIVDAEAAEAEKLFAKKVRFLNYEKHTQLTQTLKAGGRDAHYRRNVRFVARRFRKKIPARERRLRREAHRKANISGRFGLGGRGRVFERRRRLLGRAERLRVGPQSCEELGTTKTH